MLCRRVNGNPFNIDTVENTRVIYAKRMPIAIVGKYLPAPLSWVTQAHLDVDITLSPVSTTSYSMKATLGLNDVQAELPKRLVEKKMAIARLPTIANEKEKKNANEKGKEKEREEEQEVDGRNLSAPEKMVELLAVPIVEWMNEKRDSLQFDFDVLIYDDARDEDRFLHEIANAIAASAIIKTGAKVTQLFSDIKSWFSTPR